jgi:hypothetical protein
MFKLTDRVTRSEATADEPAPDDHLILDLDSGNYYAVGEVGGFVWQRLDGRRTLESIAEEITTAFEVERDRAAADLLEFLERMAELGLARRVIV